MCQFLRSGLSHFASFAVTACILGVAGVFGIAGVACERKDAPTVSQDTKTPMDQSESSANIRITADIRKAILDDKSMSVNAQNCKVITESTGVVTLRGPVNSQAEKDAIGAIAKAVAGVTRVDNLLDIKPN